MISQFDMHLTYWFPDRFATGATDHDDRLTLCGDGRMMDAKFCRSTEGEYFVKVLVILHTMGSDVAFTCWAQVVHDDWQALLDGEKREFAGEIANELPGIEVPKPVTFKEPNQDDHHVGWATWPDGHVWNGRWSPIFRGVAESEEALEDSDDGRPYCINAGSE